MKSLKMLVIKTVTLKWHFWSFEEKMEHISITSVLKNQQKPS